MSLPLKILRGTASLRRHLSYQTTYENTSTHNLVPSHEPTHSALLELLSSSQNSVENLMTGGSLSFKQVADDSLRAAAKIKSCGVKPGDHVMLYSPNHENYLSALLGIMSVGAVPCLANPAYTEYELGALCKSSDIDYLIASNANHPTAAKIAAAQDIPLLYNVDNLKDFVSGCGAISEVYDSDINDTAVIGYSSGTTGLPKGVQLTHLNLNYQRCIISHEDMFNPDIFDRPQVNLMPWYHAFGFTQAALCVQFQCDIKLLTHFDPAVFLKAMAEHRTKMLAAVPPILLFLAKHPVVAQFDLTSITYVISGAAPLTANLLQELVAKHPNMTSVRQGYGMTETTAGLTFQLPGCTKHGSVGVPLPFCKYRVVDPETDEPILDGGPGELLLGGPGVMKGYYNNDAANAETLTSDGFVRTGDVGTTDKDGVLWITDRLKELIKVKGYQVAPAELEGVLTSHPLIADAAVIGVPDDRAGEVPKAFVTPAPGVSLSEEDVKKFIVSRLSSEKQLGYVEFMDVIPKLPSGKILRKDLRKLEESRKK